MYTPQYYNNFGKFCKKVLRIFEILQFFFDKLLQRCRSNQVCIFYVKHFYVFYIPVFIYIFYINFLLYLMYRHIYIYKCIHLNTTTTSENFVKKFVRLCRILTNFKTSICTFSCVLHHAFCCLMMVVKYRNM